MLKLKLIIQGDERRKGGEERQATAPKSHMFRKKREGTDIKEMQRGGKGKEIRCNTSLIQFSTAVLHTANTFTFESCFMDFGIMNPQQNQSPVDLLVELPNFYIDTKFC